MQRNMLNVYVQYMGCCIKMGLMLHLKGKLLNQFTTKFFSELCIYQITGPSIVKSSSSWSEVSVFISNCRSIYLRQLLLTVCLICIYRCVSVLLSWRVVKRRHAICGVPQRQRNKWQLLQTLTSIKTSH